MMNDMPQLEELPAPDMDHVVRDVPLIEDDILVVDDPQERS